MEAHGRTVREILHSGDQFLGPFCQRHYSWRKENWQRLLDDIVALTEESEETKPFLGPLVCTPFHPVPDRKSGQMMLGGNWQTLHEKWIHPLGNLTLTGYNPELGNGNFTDKRAAFAESNVSLNQPFVRLTQWTDQEIKLRGLELAHIVARIWPRPTGGPGYISPAPVPSEPEEFPFVRLEAGQSEGEGRGRSKLLIRVRWSRLGKTGADEDICEPKATTTMAVFLGKLIRAFGEPMAERLTRAPVSRGHPLSANPAVDFLNPTRGAPYNHQAVPGTSGLYVFTNLSNKEKRDDLRQLSRLLEFPPDGVEVSLVD